jgi:hypothetical protein
MKLKYYTSIIGIGAILLIISLIILNHIGFINLNSTNDTRTIINPTIIPTAVVSVDPYSSLIYPSNDIAINGINWSSYPNLQTGYVFLVCIAEPTNVIPHKFIEVQICTEVKDTENRTIIINQLNGVAKEAKQIYGPYSSINIIGTKGGVARWFASILPNDDKINN